MMKKQPILSIPSKKEIKDLLTIPNKRDKAIIQFLICTGLRISEFVQLSYYDIYNNNGVIKNTISIKGKGSKIRTVPLNNQAKDSIKTLDNHNRNKTKNINSDTPLLLNHLRKQMSSDYASKIVREWARKCEIDMPVSAHTLRHVFVTMLLQKGVNMKEIQTLVGHSSIKTTLDIYSHPTQQDLIKAVGKIKL